MNKPIGTPMTDAQRQAVEAYGGRTSPHVIPVDTLQCPACKQKELLRYLPRKQLRLRSFCTESDKTQELIYQRTVPRARRAKIRPTITKGKRR